MPRVTRTFETDLAELVYQIARSEAFLRIVAEFQGGGIDDAEAQEQIHELLDLGRCKFHGDRGPEEWTWALTDREAGTVGSILFREKIEG